MFQSSLYIFVVAIVFVRKCSRDNFAKLVVRLTFSGPFQKQLHSR